MANNGCSAPKIKFDGSLTWKKNTDWKIILPIEFFERIGQDKRLTPAARLYLIVVCGQAEDFKISERTILNLTGMSHTTFIRARELLEKIGYITIVPAKETIIHIDRIMGLESSEQPNKPW